MKKKPAALIAGLGCTLASGAFATPMTPIFGDSAVEQARMVCNENGRCYNQDENPGEAIARGVMRGIEGRGGERDYDHDRGYNRNRDRDRRRERDDDD